MTIPDKYTNADDTPTLEGWKRLVRDLHKGGSWGEPMTAAEIAEELGMDGSEGLWSVKDVEEAIHNGFDQTDDA
jgi:hypothetical protein